MDFAPSTTPRYHTGAPSTQVVVVLLRSAHLRVLPLMRAAFPTAHTLTFLKRSSSFGARFDANIKQNDVVVCCVEGVLLIILVCCAACFDTAGGSLGGQTGCSSYLTTTPRPTTSVLVMAVSKALVVTMRVATSLWRTSLKSMLQYNCIISRKHVGDRRFQGSLSFMLFDLFFSWRIVLQVGLPWRIFLQPLHWRSLPLLQWHWRPACRHGSCCATAASKFGHYFQKHTNCSVITCTKVPSRLPLVVAPLLCKQSLINITGTQWDPVQNVSHSGIEYRAAAYTYMNPHGVPSAGMSSHRSEAVRGMCV